MPGSKSCQVTVSDQRGDPTVDQTEGNVTCDITDVVLDMAFAGIGIARFGDFLAERAIADGLLVPLLTNCHDTDPTAISALVLPGRQRIPRARVLLDFLKVFQPFAFVRA